ncbi:hypothetical protein [Nodosilinea sp. E11]|uniref:hypothetical protein n=1 Tax=Nodosilinea sp. E11 TaxID=3037479 RepID=UPI00293514B2|nr:hypothetical protein [Nodosilinea sp. E11]WOD38218.1 hypothetical protein RRF56_18565 [Nodosilinea sp. E11]
MAYLKQFSLALGLVAAAGMATPALAHNHLGELNLAHNHLDEVELVPGAVVEPADTPAADAPVAERAETVQVFETVAMPAAEASLLTLPAAAPLPNSGLFDTADIESALLAATIEVAPEATDSIDLAQAPAPGAVAVSPAYFGVGGNIGLGDRGQSALSSFGFNIISKISLGPRFSVRAGATATNDRWSFTIPVTYNFNTISYEGFVAQPYVGAGVEIPTSGDLGLLINAGADIPISPSFTLNAASNFRVTSGFAMGISLGVGYNFPFFFD